MAFDVVRFRPRLIISFALAGLLVLVLPTSLAVWAKGLIAWCVGVSLYMILIAWDMSRASIDSIRKRASALDDSAWVILLIALAATTASFGAIAALLFGGPTSSGSKAPDVALAGLTMVLSWMFIQAIFAIHYTHIFYGDDDGEQRGGLKFSEEDEPDFWDFVYFTTSVGATAQTSDTLVTSHRMRRIVTAQAVYSFFFNTAVLALAINIAAGLAGH